MKLKSRYFLAIIPPSPVNEQLMEVKQYFMEHYHCKAPLRSPAHITLQMPFWWSPQKEDQLMNSLSAFARTQNAFDLQLCDYSCFEPRVIYVQVMESPPLRSMHKVLVKYLKQQLGIFNADYKGHGFNPHITVAFRDLKKPLFYQAWEEFREKSFQASFTVNRFWLLLHDGKKWHPHREFLFAD